jgi:hypothetical protein
VAPDVVMIRSLNLLPRMSFSSLPPGFPEGSVLAFSASFESFKLKK